MASYQPETNFSAEIVPFLLNREDYVGFFLKMDPKEKNLMTFILRRKDFQSKAELMKNLAIIYDSLSKQNPA
jgi:hypothetical protein